MGVNRQLEIKRLRFRYKKINETKLVGRLRCLCILLLIFIVVCLDNGQEAYKVLCRAQYSASIGGKNEPVEGVTISVFESGAKVQAPMAYVTDKNGQVYLSLIKGKTYSITVSYKGESKTVKLLYNGEAVLLISIDPKKPLIHNITFLAPKREETEGGWNLPVSIENLIWFFIGVMFALVSSTIYHWRKAK